MKKFWKWRNQTVTNQETKEETLERTLFLNGTIAEDSWFDDDVTPKLFKDELLSGSGDITVWINSPGGECNEMFRRIHWNNRGCKSIVWRCESRLQNTGVACWARTVNEELLLDIILKAINEMILGKSGYMKMLQENIATIIRNDTSASTDEIDAKLLELQKELLQKANNRMNTILSPRRFSNFGS